MQRLLEQLSQRFPAVTFTAGSQFCWSPESGEVIYNAKSRGKQARWSLLHETGHALLGHRRFQADYELLQMEISAWEKARELAVDFDVKLEENHIQDCLDTYRDWLYRRSLCPSCATQSFQTADYEHYRCHNCHAIWGVGNDRFARTYRKTRFV
ncbi:MAG: hypothetical protein ABIV43_04115 [Candidatus Saccharimonadales bacterium]